MKPVTTFSVNSGIFINFHTVPDYFFCNNIELILGQVSYKAFFSLLKMSNDYVEPFKDIDL